ncbi:hypothetical protein [Micromonospora parathelypteridis]|uniref:PH domain-containing protein n=1 Tax=Micromonospora parathelypteridis TaxID=1839617 RepID=A0A840W781_9ACTN|nr:hypothetical protein [Micromonospora parathelypteridis]MBB5478941.1 hypothetical protein [Micromonospora parathelypteridis]
MSFGRLRRVASVSDGLWPRRFLALAVAGVVAGVTAGGLLRVPQVDSFTVSLAVWLTIGVRWLTGRWWPRRDGNLHWRERVAGLDTVEPGLVARRSLAGWVDLAAELFMLTVIGAALLASLPQQGRWVDIVRPVLAVGVAAWLGRAAYDESRFTGRLALTPSAIRHGRKVLDWTNIDRVVPHRRDARVNGVRLRPAVWRSLQPAPVVGGRDTSVPEDRLIAAIEEYRNRPADLAREPAWPARSDNEHRETSN